MWYSGYEGLFQKDLFKRILTQGIISSFHYFLPFRKSDWLIVLFHLHLRGPSHTPESVAQIKAYLNYVFKL